MYKVRPLQGTVNITCLPTCMYKAKNYFNENELNFDDGRLVQSIAGLSLGELEDLTKQQNKQFRKLERLINKSNELCEDLRLDNLVLSNVNLTLKSENKLEEVYQKQESLFEKINRLSEKVKLVCEEMNLKNLTNDMKSLNLTKKHRKVFQVDSSLFKDVTRSKTKAVTDKGVEDLVIYVSPNKIPYELLSYFDLLSQRAKTFAKFYCHSSISDYLRNNSDLENRLLSIGELFEGLRLGVNDSRTSYDFGFTFIWKQMDSSEPELKLSNGTSVNGQNKIIESVNQLLPQELKVTQDGINQNQTSSVLLKVLKSL